MRAFAHFFLMRNTRTVQPVQVSSDLQCYIHDHTRRNCPAVSIASTDIMWALNCEFGIRQYKSNAKTELFYLNLPYWLHIKIKLKKCFTTILTISKIHPCLFRTGLICGTVPSSNHDMYSHKYVFQNQLHIFINNV